jgi:RNA polymerase sigma-70 factor (ECF subfamily)
MQFREMVERAGRGDYDAFEAVVRASVGRLCAIAYRILRDVDLAKDALQEALAKVWDDLPTLRDPDCFEAWAARITCRSCYRLAMRERRFALPTPTEPRPDTAAFVAHVADQDEMERGFRRLSPEDRAVLVLHYYLGLTLSGVADTLGIGYDVSCGYPHRPGGPRLRQRVFTTCVGSTASHGESAMLMARKVSGCRPGSQPPPRRGKRPTSTRRCRGRNGTCRSIRLGP